MHIIVYVIGELVGVLKGLPTLRIANDNITGVITGLCLHIVWFNFSFKHFL